MSHVRRYVLILWREQNNTHEKGNTLQSSMMYVGTYYSLLYLSSSESERDSQKNEVEANKEVVAHD